MIIEDILERIKALEKHSHEPFDFSALIKRLERVEQILGVVLDPPPPKKLSGCPHCGFRHPPDGMCV